MCDGFYSFIYVIFIAIYANTTVKFKTDCFFNFTISAFIYKKSTASILALKYLSLNMCLIISEELIII